MVNFRRPIFSATSLLLGCKADSLEIKLSDKDIQSAIAGEAVAIDFEAEFSMLGELDDENKATLDQLLVLAEEFLSLDDFEKLQNTITNIRGTTLKSNELRLFIGEAINKRNLSVEDTLYTIYELLEEAVDAYDLFQAELTILESQLSEVSKKIPKNLDKDIYLTSVAKAFQRRFRQELVNGKIDRECLLISKNLVGEFK